jgi:hypothetical protein
MHASDSKMEWFARYYAAIDAFDFDALAGFLAEDVRAQTATGAEVIGRDEVIARGRATYGTMDRIHHELRNVWEEDGDQLVFELEVTYHRPDGEVISRPGMGIFVVRDGLVHEQRLFVDSNAAYA